MRIIQGRSGCIVSGIQHLVLLPYPLSLVCGAGTLTPLPPPVLFRVWMRYNVCLAMPITLFVVCNGTACKKPHCMPNLQVIGMWIVFIYGVAAVFFVFSIMAVELSLIGFMGISKCVSWVWRSLFPPSSDTRTASIPCSSGKITPSLHTCYVHMRTCTWVHFVIAIEW